MRVMVCGSVAYGGFKDVRRTQKNLAGNGFDVVDQFRKRSMAVLNIKDFRRKKRLAQRIVRNDFRAVGLSDVLVLLAAKPSFGSGAEAHLARRLGKKIILLAPTKTRSPWPVAFSDYIVASNQELILVLRRLERKKF